MIFDKEPVLTYQQSLRGARQLSLQACYEVVAEPLGSCYYFISAEVQRVVVQMLF